MLLFLFIGGSAKLLVMGALSSAVRYFSSLVFVIMSDYSFLCFSIEKKFPLCRASKKRLLAMLKMEQ